MTRLIISTGILSLGLCFNNNAYKRGKHKGICDILPNCKKLLSSFLRQATNNIEIERGHHDSAAHLQVKNAGVNTDVGTF